MITTAEIALLALRAYSTPSTADIFTPKRDLELNRPAVPADWIEIEWNVDEGDGFSYGIYRKQGETIIAYAGSNQTIDFVSNVMTAAGLGSSQITKAAIAYLQAQKQYGGNITFTGHSLGGGLASVMAVWFDRPAIVFNEAPFELTALNPIVMGAVALAMELIGYSVPALRNFISTYTLTYEDREFNVSNYYLQGEVLAGLRAALPTVLGSGQDHIVKTNVNGDDGQVDPGVLHSQALLTSMLLSEAFRQATYLSNSVIPTIMDPKFYKPTLDNKNENILTNFIRSEQGTGKKLTHLAADLQRLGTDLDGLSTPAQKAIIAQTIEWYYWNKKDYAGQEFFASNAGQPGLLQYSTASGAGLPDAQDKAAIYLGAWLTPLYNASGEFGGNWHFDQWNVAAGSQGVAASAITAGKTQIFIGAAGEDQFIGGERNDVIFGGDGADTLDAGGGSDTLLGGAGSDTYRFRGDWGQDTVIDSDGAGAIEVDGIRLQGGKKVGEKVWANQEQGFVFSLIGSGAQALLVVQRTLQPSQIHIKGWQAGQLGLTMDDTPVPVTASRIYRGDQHGPLAGASGEEHYDWTTTEWLPDGTLQGGVAEADFNDVLIGSNGNDRLEGLGGNDALDGREGADELLGGMGDDLIAGGAGSDLIEGGDGHDFIYTALNLYLQHRRSPQQKWTPPAGQVIIAGSTWGVYSIDGSAYQVTGMDDRLEKDASGDIAYGGPGHDRITGGLGRDYLYGDEGDDRIYGMGGSDFLSGGDGADHLNGDGTRDADRAQTLDIDLHGDDVIDGGAGDDTLLGGGGDDILFGGAGSDAIQGDYVQTKPTVAAHGNDYIDGGDGDDSIIGGSGADQILGGAGADTIYGDDLEAVVPGADHGVDRIDGGEGSDHLYGQGSDDFLSGGSDNDILSGDHSDLSGTFHGNDVLDGGAGNDELIGDGKDDVLYGGTGDDTLWGDGSKAALAGEFHGNDRLDGEDGSDQLIGGGRDDILRGGAGDDILFGDDEPGGLAAQFHGTDDMDGGDGKDMLVGGGMDDILHGGTGSDQLEGDALGLDPHYHGNDSLDGGADDDALWGDGGNDHLSGGDGNDKLTGDNDGLALEFHGHDVLDGGAGDDVLWGNGGNDILRGGAGDDQLKGDDGNDLLHGGAGVDLLEGGAGDDTYIIDAADLPTSSTALPETILDNQGSNTLQLTGSATFSTAAGGHLGLFLGNVDEARALVIKNAFSGSFGPLILDGRETTLRAWVQQHVTTKVQVVASAGQSVFGGGGDDFLRADDGGSTLYGGKGNDTYDMNAANRKGGITVQLSQGDGLDDAVSFWVASGTLAVRAANVLRFGPGITAQSLRLEYRAGRNGFGWGPHLAYGDQNDAIAITSGGWDDASNSRLHPFDEMQFADGSKMDWSELEALGLRLDLAKYPGEATRVSGSEFRDIIIGTDAHHVIHASGGDDWIDAGTGDNSIFPGKGSDTVLFGQGSGRDRVLSTRDDRADGDIDSLQFKAGIAPADLLFLRLGDNLVVKIKGSADILTVVDAYAGNPIDHVRFDDGTRIAFTALPIASAKDEATTGADTINLAPTGETVDALDGDDIVYGEAGNDVIHGGPGIDKLYGGAGDDILEDSDGAYFWGGDGNDTIRGRAIDTNAVSVEAGPGNDVLDVIARRILLGTGNDTLILRAAANELTVIADGATQAGDIRTIRFSAGIAPSSVTAHFAGDDLLIACSDVERLAITGAANLESGIQQGYIFIFDDSPSTIWTYQHIFRMASTPTAGNDGLPGTPDADVIDGLDGNDVIHGRSGNDILRGSGGNDILYGGDGDDILIAGTGYDDLYGGDGDDILYASTGATGFFGGLGSDTFRIGGSGTHVIESESLPEKDVIEFEFGVTPQDIGVRRQLSILDHAALTVSSGGTVIIRNFFAKNSLDGVQKVRFLSAPETVWTAEQLREMAIMGTPAKDIIFGYDFRNDFIAAGGGDDRIYGRGGDDILDAGPENDILDGSSGDDTYIYRIGYGQDIIFDKEGFDTLN